MGRQWGRVRRVCGTVCLSFLLMVIVTSPALAMRGASGSRVLTWRYAGSTSQADMRVIVPAAGGGAFAAGSTESNGSPTGDVLAVKFGASKTPEWTRTWDSGVGGAYAWDATSDREGDLVVGGITTTATSSADWVVLKYSPSGELVWSQTVAGESTSSDYLNAVACDRAGNVYAAGSLQDATGNHCFAVVKLAAADGTVLWRHVVDGLNPAWHDDQAEDVVVDGRGNAYATGISFSAGDVDSRRRCMTVKLTAAGDEVWSRVIERAGFDRYGYYLALVGSSLYVQMFGSQPGETNPLMLAKYTTGGTRSWFRIVPVKHAATVYPYAIAANATGAIVVADGDEGSGLIVKMTPGGRVAWSHVYLRSQKRTSRRFQGVCMDTVGRVWAAGTAVPPGPTAKADWLIQRFGASGRVVWAKTLGGIQDGWDGLNTVTLSGTSSLWVAGHLADATGAVQWPTVGKYRR